MSLRTHNNHILPFYKGSICFDLHYECYEEGKGLKVSGYVKRSKNPLRRMSGFIGYYFSQFRDWILVKDKGHYK